MATIALYAGKINNMPSLIKDVRKSVEKYNKELAGLYQKTLKVDAGVCDLGEVMDSLRASSQTQEQRIEILENFQENSEDFIQDTIRIDNNVAETVDQNKDDFYDKYDYLKPDCEKSGWEKFCDACKAVGEWCKEHWKLIVTVVLVVVAVVVIVVTAGAGAGPIAMLLAGMAKGLLGGALMGGLLGGLSSVAAGGSFLEGFENGAFSGALMGALMGGIGAAGSLLGGSCTFAGTAIGRLFDTVIPIMGKVTGGISGVMALFDTAAFVGGLFDPGNALTQLNQKLHENAAYNVFQITVSALAVFSGGFMKGAQNRACFVAGTMVLTACGLVAIENIKAGDKVIAANPETGKTEIKTVLETYVRNVTELVHLSVNGEKIITTHDHPFYVYKKGYISAGQLKKTDKLVDSEGRISAIDQIQFATSEEPICVYNFKVEEFHTYFVGHIHILVHNADYNQTPKEIISERTQDLDTNEHPSKTKQITAKEKARLKAKVEDRTITKEEYKSLKWNEKMARRRQEGVSKFWEQERSRLQAGENGTRNWSPQQKADILNGKTPQFNGKPIQGHHSYSVSKYPHLASKGEGIFPATANEHFNGWHGGNYKNSLPGEPISAIFDF